MRVLRLTKDANVHHRIIGDGLEEASDIAGKAILGGFDIESQEFDWDDVSNDSDVTVAVWIAVESGLPFAAGDESDGVVLVSEDATDEEIDLTTAEGVIDNADDIADENAAAAE